MMTISVKRGSYVLTRYLIQFTTVWIEELNILVLDIVKLISFILKKVFVNGLNHFNI